MKRASKPIRQTLTTRQLRAVAFVGSRSSSGTLSPSPSPSSSPVEPNGCSTPLIMVKCCSDGNTCASTLDCFRTNSTVFFLFFPGQWRILHANLSGYCP